MRLFQNKPAGREDVDIGSIGAQYLEQNRYGVEKLRITRGTESSAAPGSPSFAEYLEQAAAQSGGKTESGSPAPGAGPGNPAIDKTSKLYEQCQELEMFLVKNLLTGMRNTVQKTGLIEEGLAGKFYEDMLWDEYARTFTRNAGFGLADQAYLELTGQRGRPLRGPAAG
jgi:flagellar protein FlgJ